MRVGSGVEGARDDLARIRNDGEGGGGFIIFKLLFFFFFFFFSCRQKQNPIKPRLIVVQKAYLMGLPERTELSVSKAVPYLENIAC